ncbi:hypothetical protein COL05_26890 [Bacillus sp. AFS059628]|uniref:hypothetical protein n=1 Tax=Bacillus sp. AFS059628 TaxID=2033508 RepID=UPI000BF92F64|nr:hypothetical protein [Bacillus sp. AFS059628]PFV71944.1 hypothetical protein COL05_26890 [Bacillus sp. AFS059628]
MNERENCNEYITWCASFLETSNEAEKTYYQNISYRNQRSIWGLIDKYIEEENKLIEELM